MNNKKTKSTAECARCKRTITQRADGSGLVAHNCPHGELCVLPASYRGTPPAQCAGCQGVGKTWQEAHDGCALHERLPAWVARSPKEASSAPVPGPAVTWSGELDPPPLGGHVKVRDASLSGVVVGYVVECGYLHVVLKIDKPPSWHERQSGHGFTNIAGAEIMTATDWVKSREVWEKARAKSAWYAPEPVRTGTPRTTRNNAAWGRAAKARDQIAEDLHAQYLAEYRGERPVSPVAAAKKPHVESEVKEDGQV